MVKIYELPRDKGIKIKVTTNRGEEMIVFHHLDGMYSYCTAEDGEIMHLSASTPLIEKDGYYEIAQDEDGLS